MNRFTNDEFSAFLTLADHCILTIMGKQPLADILAMADVSVRLRQLSLLHFRTKYRNFHTNMLATDGRKITLNQARSLFVNFGHLMTTLYVSMDDFGFNDSVENRAEGSGQLMLMIRENTMVRSLVFDEYFRNYVVEFNMDENNRDHYTIYFKQQIQ